MLTCPLLRVAAIFLVASSPAMAGERDLRESRSRAMEMRAERKKVQEQMKADGFTPMAVGGKIVGGSDASEGEYPWMVALVDADEESNYDGQFCGGTLIHPYWVITAAHCVAGMPPENVEVVLGATDLSDSPEARRIAVAEVILAPGYNDYTLDADFALLRLKEPADERFTPLSLADDPSLVEPGVLATITGWGDTTYREGEYASRLQELQVPIVPGEEGAEDYDFLTENMLVAGYAEGGKDSCPGDSGGPLLVPSAGGTGWVLGGVISFGCTEPGLYGGHTKIGNYRDFVIGHIFPNYAEWERKNGRSGEYRDPDGNGFGNFEDFALPDHVLDRTTAGGMLHFSYVRPAEAGEVDYILENAPTSAGPWARMSPAFVSSLPQGSGLSRWTVALPEAGNGGEFRIRAIPSRTLVTHLRPLPFAGGTTGSLGASDLSEPEGLSRWYRLRGLPAGRSVMLTLRSREFDPVLHLVEAATGEVILSSANGSAGGVGGRDEKLEFTPQAGTEYLVKVAGGAEGAGFELNLWEPAAFASATALPVQWNGKKSRPTVIKGSLAATDGVDPHTQPGPVYFKDDYLLDTSLVPDQGVVDLRIKSKGKKGIDSFLYLIDAESGRKLEENDSFTGKTRDAGLRFMPLPGKAYLVRASSSAMEEVGAYSVTASIPKLTKKSPLALISPGITVRGKLSPRSESDVGTYRAKRDYLLEALPVEQSITVNLSSPKFDASLIVLDAFTLETVKSTNGEGKTAKLDFVARPGHRYIIRAATYWWNESGPYTLSISQTP